MVDFFAIRRARRLTAFRNDLGKIDAIADLCFTGRDDRGLRAIVR
jgi:hypothetical protein